MRLRNRDEHLDPREERELDAIDRALSGRPVDPDLAEWGELALLVADERPEPAPEWSAELDERAAARFRDAGSRPPLSPGAFFERFKPMQILAPAGALATAAVIALVGVSTLGDQGNGEQTQLSSQPVPESSTTIESADSGVAATGGASSAEAVPEVAPEQGIAADSAAPVAPSPDDSVSSQAFPAEGKIAPGTDKRQVERDVSLTLSTRPESVRDVSDEAIAITRSLDGIVASSQVSSAGKQASAALQLTIPTRNLDTALDRLTDLANVKSLDEATLDITRPYVSAQDQLRDAEAERRSLLEALANASTKAEADSLRLQIADARRAISQAEAAFENVARRARLSDVSLSIVGDPNVDEDRSIGDWFDDALSVLRDVAGVLLISAAILIPLGILVGLTWLIVSRLRRRRRERTLDA